MFTFARREDENHCSKQDLVHVHAASSEYGGEESFLLELMEIPFHVNVENIGSFVSSTNDICPIYAFWMI